MYRRIVEEFKCSPRDIHTVPTNKRPYKWFFVFAENNVLYIEGAHNNSPKSVVKRRQLHEKECNDILKIYHRRLNGENVSKEAQELTFSQVYWFGIFSALNL